MPFINLFDFIKTKEDPLKGVFIHKLLNNPIASCYLINFNFLQSHIAHPDKTIILPFFVLRTFGFLVSGFFDTSQNMITLFYK